MNQQTTEETSRIQRARGLVSKYVTLAKEYGTTAQRQECKIAVPSYDFDEIINVLYNFSKETHLKRGYLDIKGKGYYETYPNAVGQYYNPDIVTLVRE